MRNNPMLGYRVTLLALAVGVVVMMSCRAVRERSALAQISTGGALANSATDAPAAAVAIAPARLRRLWAGGRFNFTAAAPSPDGRWITENDAGNLAVRDLATGTLYRLTEGAEVSGGYAANARFAPDGRRVVYGWYNPETGDSEIRILDFTVDEAGMPHASDPRIVHPGRPQWGYPLDGWTADDQILTQMVRPDQTTSLGFLSLATGSYRAVKSFDWLGSRAALSGDGRYIAYDHAPDPDAPDERDIYLLSADGRLDDRLISGPGNDVLMGWLPGDHALLFYSDRSGTPSVWRLPLADGHAAGPPAIVQQDVRNLEPLGFGRGAFYFGVQVDAPAFRTAALDIEHQRISILPTVFRPPHGGDGQALDWSPDGKYVIQSVDDRQGMTFFVRTAAGTVIRELHYDLGVQRRGIRWTPDGKSLVLSAVDELGRKGFFRIDLGSGDHAMVRRFDPPGESARAFSISPDSRTLYHARIASHDGELDPDLVEIVALDLETGTERSIRRVTDPGQVEVSPDGAWLAYRPFRGPGANTIQLIPINGGGPPATKRFEVPRSVVSILGWTPDGESILFLAHGDRTGDSARGSTSSSVELWRLHRAGGPADHIAAIPGYIAGGRLHPNGRTIAYRGGQWRSEVWALDGLTPAGSTRAANEGRPQ